MDYPANGGPRYEVYCAAAVAKSIQQVQEQASEEGRGQQVLDAFRHAIERLQRDPKRFGERLFRLPFMRMHVCTAVIRPIAIDFAVCTDRPMVFIKSVKLLSR